MHVGELTRQADWVAVAKVWNPETKTESWKWNTGYRIKYKWQKIKEFHIASFSKIQTEFVWVFLAVPLNIFLLYTSNFYSNVYGLNDTVKYYLFR